MAPALLLTLLIAQPKVLLYTVQGDPNELASYDVSTWEVGHRLFIAVDQASLLEAPEEQARVVTSLALGTPVKVTLRLAERSRVLDRVDHWYQVEAKAADGKLVRAYVFGNLLTPLRYEGDLDGDGEQELATVAMTADFKIRVRVLEPGLPPHQRVVYLDLMPGGEGLGGSVKASLVPAKKAGVALLTVESLPRADSSRSTAFLSYVVPKRARGTRGTVLKSLALRERSDPPIVVRQAVSFDRRKRRLIAVETNKGELRPGKTVSIRRVYQWENGLYTEVRKKR
jgi:hypothetical protein